MAGTGYNIPISVSVADTFSVPQNLTAPTYVNFGKAGDIGGDITPAALSYAPATAVSSAAEGNAAAANTQSQPSVSNLWGLLKGGHPVAVGSVAVLAVAAIVVGIWYYRKHHS